MPGLPLRCGAGAEVGAIREKGLPRELSLFPSREAWESTRLKTGLTVRYQNRPSRRFKPCPRHQENILTQRIEKLKKPKRRLPASGSDANSIVLQDWITTITGSPQLISRWSGILLSESDGGPEQSGCKPEYTE